jgi:PAS domain S-box-containing protein
MIAIVEPRPSAEPGALKKLLGAPAAGFLKLGVAEKIYTIVALLVLLTVLLVATSIQSVRLQNNYRVDLESSATAMVSFERVNGLVYAAVMESRGIYMSTDKGKLKFFGDELLRRTRELAQVMTEWETTIRAADADKFAILKKRVLQFIDFRRELVRLTREVSQAAGREWGDNDANRAVRIALNADLEALAASYRERTQSVAELGDTARLASWYLAALGAGALLLAGFNVFVMRRFVIKPLADITAATDCIASGQINLVIPHIERTDEIGKLASAVQKFREAANRNVELEQREIGTAQQRDAVMGERDRLNDKYNAKKWQLSAAIHSMPQGVMMLNAAGQIVVVNDRYRKIYGLPAAIKVGSSLSDIVRFMVQNGVLVGSVSKTLEGMKARIARQQPTSGETELGDGRIIRVAEQPMAGGGWVSTHDDVTEQLKMQRILERTERFLVTVIENVPDAIAAKDARSLRYVFVNRAAEDLFELPRASIIGKTARELFTPAIADMIEQGDKRLLDGDEPLEMVINRIETAAGPRLRGTRRIPIRGPDGESRVFLSIIEDRTGRMDAEASIVSVPLA